MMEFGAQNMVGPLAQVVMRRPGQALAQADAALWHYGCDLDFSRLLAQHDTFAELVSRSGAEIHWLEEEDDGLADAIFTHDPSLVTNRGAILLNMGKELRRAEPDLHRRCYERLGIPVLGEIRNPGRVEGGDCLWLDDSTLVVGRGFRTNSQGVAQLTRLLDPMGIQVVVVDLPVYKGAEACLHLMSLISMIDHDLALIYKSLMPVALFELLRARGIAMIEAPASEFEASGGLNLNLLAMAPRHGVMIAGQEKTERALREAGCRIDTFEGDMLCIACEGGPTCLTRPILRY